MGTELGNGFTERAREDVTSELLDYKSGSLSATRFFIGPWANRFAFIRDNLQNSYPHLPQAIVTRVDIQGKGGADTQEDSTLNFMPKWDRALLTVSYESLLANPISRNRAGDTFGTPEFTQQEEKDQKFIEETIEASPEFLNIDGKDILDDAGNKLHDEGRFNKLIVHLNITLRVPSVAFPNWDAIQARIGDVNDSGFVTPSGFSSAAETIRYDGPSGITKINPVIGTRESGPLPSWDMTHNFAFNRRGWNFKFVKNKWQRITDANGNPLFRIGDLYSIFFGFNSQKFNASSLQAISDNQKLINDILDDPGFNEDGADFIAISKIINDQIRNLGFRIPVK